MRFRHATGEYRLVRQVDGHTAYAHVRVEVVPTGSGPDAPAQWSVDPADSDSAQPARDPDLVRAALDGVAAALDDLGRMGVDTRGQTVHVRFVGMTVTDTEPSAVRAVAAAATVSAFGMADRFEVAFDSGWQCQPRGH